MLLQRCSPLKRALAYFKFWRNMRSIFYLDTSALNFLADNVKDFDFLAGMKEHLKFELFLSPVSLWEVFLNSNEERRDYLIYWAQFNCARKLIKSPSEIIIEYIKQDCPIKDRTIFRDAPYSNMQMAETWENIHGKIDRTIPLDVNELKERSNGIRQLSKSLKGIINDMCDDSHENYENDPFHGAMVMALENVGRSLELDKKTERTYKITLIFIFFIICIGFELQNSVIQDFWNEKGIEDPFERLDFMIANYSELMVRGPVLEMAMMAETQLKMDNSKSRGLLHDCMHTIYCYYADNLITSDTHFECLRDDVNHPVFKGIIMTSQIQEIWELAKKKLTSQSSLTA